MKVISISSPTGDANLKGTLATIHSHLVARVLWLDDLSPLSRLRVTEDGDSLIASGTFDLWLSSVYDGCQEGRSDFDIRWWNHVVRVLGDQGADIPFIRQNKVGYFTLK